jgi:hypothetical protein
MIYICLMILICLLTFIIYQIIKYSRETNRLYDECRDSLSKAILEIEETRKMLLKELDKL